MLISYLWKLCLQVLHFTLGAGAEASSSVTRPSRGRPKRRKLVSIELKFHYKEPPESKCPDTALGVQYLLSAPL